MRLQVFIFVIFTLVYSGLFSQQNSIRTEAPYPGYWQQTVDYTMDLELLDSIKAIGGSIKLNYTNNSPDTLKVFYFHLYQNIYKEGSYAHRYLSGGVKISVEVPHGTEIRSFKQKGSDVTYSIDNTLLKATPVSFLPPGTSTEFSYEFITYFNDEDLEAVRMKYFNSKGTKNGKPFNFTHFDAVHFYPRISVYDRCFGWDVNQHLGHEFYGDFGSFKVSLKTPSYYILDGTGVLENEKEMLPENFRKKIDIRNFKEKNPDSLFSEPFDTYKGFKVWKFKAEKVHDFAFTADPTYRLGETKWEDVRCIALAREENARYWQDADSFVAKVIEFYSGYYGRYLYPKMIAADAKDGMEYPMLTLDGGRSPGYYSLFAHEIGHNWFYGMVGSNETYRAFLDEGFTQFSNILAMEQLVGKNEPGLPLKLKGIPVRMVEGYGSYLTAAIEGNDGILETHSDMFKNESQYGQVYSKTATMLYNFQYVLGDSLFQKAMAFYFNRWKLGHPYPEDFRQAMHDATGRDLNWFFDQWLNTNQIIDYSVTGLANSQGKAKITFKRKGEMQMPVDFAAITSKKDTLWYTIPNTISPKEEVGLKVLPQWYGFGKIQPTYSAEIESPDKIRKVIIDPSRRMADVNLLNNQSGLFPVRFTLVPGSLSNFFPDWKGYTFRANPNIWWNAVSGLQLGAEFGGNYLGNRRAFKIAAWYSTGWPVSDNKFDESLNIYKKDYQVFNYRFSFRNPFRPFGTQSFFTLKGISRDGADQYSAELDKVVYPRNSRNSGLGRFYAGYTYLFRKEISDNNYLIYPDLWNTGSANAYIKAGAEYSYSTKKGFGFFRLESRASAFGSDQAYSNVRLLSRQNQKLGKMDLRVRGIIQYGEGNTPLESQTYLAGGSPEEMYQNEFYRARGFFNPSLNESVNGTFTNNLNFGGGYGLRGYTGYRAEFEDGSHAWYANSGGAVNMELEFDRFLKKVNNPIFKFTPYLFADAGILARNKPRTGIDALDFDKIRIDAGAGIALSVGENIFPGVKPFVLRFDFPVFLNTPPATEEFFQFRWQVGIGRAF